ncbi:MAG TPA: hypothetical protein VF170_18335, partial [Planctomycetaceae bacterium]
MATKRRNGRAARERRGDIDQDNVGGFEAGEDVVDAFARLAGSSRPQGKSRRRRGDDAKGLPDPETLNGLAKLYLDVQRRLWPDLARRGLLPKPTPKAVERLAAEFEARFRGGEPATVGVPLASPPWQELAAAYVRFSDESSNP